MNEQILNPTFRSWVAEFLQRGCELLAAILITILTAQTEGTKDGRVKMADDWRQTR